MRQWNLSGSRRWRHVAAIRYFCRDAVPYVGAGAGMLRALEQHGEFRDAVDGAVFAANPQSSAWVPEFHVLAGVDIRLTPRVAATVEARYLQAHAQLTEDFAGFEPLDLSGLRVSAGLRRPSAKLGERP